MTPRDDSERLLQRVRQGDHSAVGELFDRHRSRLRRLVDMRINPLLSARIDPSDVVQESFAAAATHLSGFLRQGSDLLYPWLRKIAVNRMLDLQREHILADRRSVTREISLVGQLSEPGRLRLSELLIAHQDRPSEHLLLEEQKAKVRAALELLSASDREVLALRFLEQLSTREAAAVLEISENSFAQRQLRALKRLRKLLQNAESSSS